MLANAQELTGQKEDNGVSFSVSAENNVPLNLTIDPIAKAQTKTSISRLVVGTSEHQIAQSGHTHKRFRVGSKLYTKTR
jgi:hypothetical protein